MRWYVSIIIFLFISFIIIYDKKKFLLPNFKRITNKEEKCREIFENIFNVKFQKIRPDFLKSKKSNRNLELDGFNKDIVTNIGKGLAFEYNGEQHYHFTPKYQKRIEDFHKQLERDKIKRDICKKQGIALIIIPYNVKFNNLNDFIINKLLKYFKK